VAAVGRKHDPVAFAKLPVLIFALDAEPRRARDDQHPLVGHLVVPFPVRRRLSRRDDSLDAQARLVEEDLNDLLGKRPRWQALLKSP
jgi:hypothetical protein